MTSHSHWQSPTIEQRRDQKEVWEDLGQFLDHLDDFKRRLTGRRILVADPF